MREQVTIQGTSFFVPTKFVDLGTYEEAYTKGYYKPNYPVPVLRRIVDILPDELIVWVSTNEASKDYATYRIERDYCAS